MNTYLGQKGYTLSKEELSPSVQAKVKQDLTIQPFTLNASDAKVYPMYRESGNKLYVPRDYGIRTFGPPKQVKLNRGDAISLAFQGTLRPNQQLVVDTYLRQVQGQEFGGGLLELPCAYGKCLAKDTPLLMYDGSVCVVQDVKVGDLLMGDDSTPRRILSLARGRERMYRISNHFGDQFVCNESHILSLKSADGVVNDISVREYLSHHYENHLFGYKVPIDFPERPLKIDPYLVGYWLGGGKVSDFASSSFADPRHIPTSYLRNSRENRMMLFYGLLDTAKLGHSTDATLVMGFACDELAEDVVYLIRSLGWMAYRAEGSSPQVVFHPKRELTFSLIVEPLEEDDYYGFEIDGNRRFVLGDFTVTHNTVLSLYILAQMKTKTAIIVHKEFLMNQWIERISEFLPEARVGTIQGPVINIENKDIVLCMLQSLSMKDYPSSVFSSFGLTIVDEVHHISSEVFSNALFKLVTPYTLGLSATMNRKDGTSFVFKWFLGDILFKGKRDESRDVVVRAIEYQTDDAEFNEMKYDYRGNPQYSTMISKLCEYSSRTEFILRVIRDLFLENPNQQIMVLAHNKNVLTYLHDAIVHREIATTGYYIGGMKKHALKETESKQVVIATYSMAAEALDIKTLTTLVMATPKTDIEQSVGRILREKHSHPLVIDIVDTHSLFKNQWQKRKAFYKQENYKITYITSRNYLSVHPSWKVVFDPCVGKRRTTQVDSEEEDAEPSGSTEPSLVDWLKRNGALVKKGN